MSSSLLCVALCITIIIVGSLRQEIYQLAIVTDAAVQHVVGHAHLRVVEPSSETDDDHRVLLDDSVAVAVATESFPTTRSPQDSSSSQTRTSSIDKLSHMNMYNRLQVPFYIYDDNGLDWSNVTSEFGAFRPKNYTNRTYYLVSNSSTYPQYKHSDDYWLLRHAFDHPMRTRDPSKAKLFFVPLLLNALNVHAFRNELFCLDGKCDMDLLRYADEVLWNSPWFQRSKGSDHILVESHYLKLTTTRKLQNSSLMSCNHITFEKKISETHLRGIRKFIPAFYVGSPCENTNRTADFAMIATLKPNNRNFKVRDDICSWLKAGNYSVSLCGQGRQCPALAQARYGFHPRGDSYGSNRLMDTLLSGTVPLYTDSQQLDILPHLGIPWKKLGYLINVSSKAAFDRSLQLILKQPEEKYQKKKDLIAKYRPLLDHTEGYQFDAFMAKFADKLSIA